MKTLFILCLALCLGIGNNYAQFHANYDSYFKDYAHSMDYLTGADYIFAGKNIGQGSQGMFSSISKIDNNGNLVWNKAYHNVHLFNAVRYMGEDPEFMAAGVSNGKGLLVGYKKNGTEIYSYNYQKGSYLDNTTFDFMQSTKNRGGKEMIILGTTQAYGSGRKNMLVSLMDYYGNEINSTEIIAEVGLRGTWIEPLREGGFVVTGEINYTCSEGDRSDINILVMKLDDNLRVLWTKVIQGIKRFEKISQNYAQCIKEDQNGDLVITGYSNQFVTRAYADLQFLAKLDREGNPYWVTTYGPYSVSFGKSSLITREEGEGYTIASSIYDADGTDGWDAVLFNIKNDGVLASAYTYGMPFHYIQAGTDLNDNHRDQLSFVGHSITYGDFELHLFQTDKQGKMNGTCENEPNIETVKHEFDYCNIGLDYKRVALSRFEINLQASEIPFNTDGCGLDAGGRKEESSTIDSQLEENKAILFPNPVRDVLHVNLLGSTQKVEILDVSGKVLMQNSAVMGDDEFQISVGHLQPGIYLLQMTNGEKESEVIRFIKE